MQLTKRINIIDFKTDTIQRVNATLAKTLVSQKKAKYTTKDRLKAALNDKRKMDNNTTIIERAERILTEQDSGRKIDTIKGATYGKEYAIVPVFRYIKRRRGKILVNTGDEFRVI